MSGGWVIVGFLVFPSEFWDLLAWHLDVLPSEVLRHEGWTWG